LVYIYFVIYLSTIGQFMGRVTAYSFNRELRSDLSAPVRLVSRSPVDHVTFFHHGGISFASIELLILSIH
jgi:hypothetical protein